MNQYFRLIVQFGEERVEKSYSKVLRPQAFTITIPDYHTLDVFMVSNATFNNSSAISWQSVLLAEETGENHRPAANH